MTDYNMPPGVGVHDMPGNEKPKMPPPVTYFIFVRPPGSFIWTMHMRATPDGPQPWRNSLSRVADSEAMRIVNHTQFCARVVAVPLPSVPDHEQYALLADGDTKWLPVGETCIRCGRVKSRDDYTGGGLCDDCDYEKRAERGTQLEEHAVEQIPELLAVEGGLLAHPAIALLVRIRAKLKSADPAIVDTIWLGPGETMLDAVEHELSEFGRLAYRTTAQRKLDAIRERCEELTGDSAWAKPEVQLAREIVEMCS